MLHEYRQRWNEHLLEILEAWDSDIEILNNIGMLPLLGGTIDEGKLADLLDFDWRKIHIPGDQNDYLKVPLHENLWFWFLHLQTYY